VVLAAAISATSVQEVPFQFSVTPVKEPVDPPKNTELVYGPEEEAPPYLAVFISVVSVHEVPS
jgi:hypothetical protein